MKSTFLDKLIERLDRLDPDSLQNHFLRLVREKGLLETIFHALQEGIVLLDGAGRITYANNAAEQMLGFTFDEAAGKHIRRYLQAVEWDRLIDYDETEWTRVINREVEITYPEHRYAAFYMVPITAADDGEKSLVVLLRDVTSERESQAVSIESERFDAIRLLAAGVAHEIGNPLNSLTIHLQLLERECRHVPGEQGDSLRDLIDVSKNEVSRLDNIINQFLKAVRPVALEMRKESLPRILRETLEFLKHEIGNRNILVEQDIDESIPNVSVDDEKIRQAFFNLIKNAIEAMGDGGLLKITMKQTDRFIEIRFRDTGPGISIEQIGRIFEPYQTTKKTGTGLGLMIVQRIVRDHGGEIEVDSDPGKGTAFTLYLPRDDARVRLLEAPPREEPTS